MTDFLIQTILLSVLVYAAIVGVVVGVTIYLICRLWRSS